MNSSQGRFLKSHASFVPAIDSHALRLLITGINSDAASEVDNFPFFLVLMLTKIFLYQCPPYNPKTFR